MKLQGILNEHGEFRWPIIRRKNKLKEEIDKLSDYFLKEELDEIKEGSAVDNAIRLLRRRKIIIGEKLVESDSK